MSNMTELLQQMAAVRAENAAMMRMMQLNQDSTNQRIDDMRHSIEGQLAGQADRIAKLEDDGKAMIWKMGGIGGTAGAVGAMLSEIAKHYFVK